MTPTFMDILGLALASASALLIVACLVRLTEDE
jgi:hypothetical protein